MNILFLSRWYPYPADNGSKLRVFNLIKQLATRHAISLVSFTSDGPDAPDHGSMRPWCARIHTAPYRDFRPERVRALAGFLSPVPRSFLDTYNVAFERLAQEEVERFAPDVVIASQIDTAPYAAALRLGGGCKRILEELEVSAIQESAAEEGGVRMKLTWAKTSRYVARLLRAFDGCTVVSEREQARVAALAPRGVPLAVVPNGVDVESCARVSAEPEPESLVYNGALTYDANFEAVDYFVRDILPIIQNSHPSVKLYVTGRLVGVPVERLSPNEGVVLTGYLDDVKPRVAQSTMTVVPLRAGGGTRLKILESLALGTPVVATSKGAEGLSLKSGHDLLIADDPRDFAAQVIRVLKSPALRAELSRNGRAAVERLYDWRTIGRQLLAFVEAIAEPPLHVGGVRDGHMGERMGTEPLRRINEWREA